MDKQPTKQQSQTAAACLARWPGSSHERWAAKRDSILVFIARLGWATRELVNYYFCQTLQSWPARMESEGLLYRQKVVIGDKTVFTRPRKWHGRYDFVADREGPKTRTRDGRQAWPADCPAFPAANAA